MMSSTGNQPLSEHKTTTKIDWRQRIGLTLGACFGLVLMANLSWRKFGDKEKKLMEATKGEGGKKATPTRHSFSSTEKAWIEKALAAHFGVVPKIIHFGPIEEASHGFTSSILRVSLQWPTHRDDLPTTIVLKMPLVSMATEAVAASMEGMDTDSKEKVKNTSLNKLSQMMHDTEAKTYALFRYGQLVHNSALFKKRNLYAGVAPFKMPLCFHSSLIGSEQPVILMEDIKEAHINDVVEGFREKQLYSIVDEIAKMHAYSFQSKEWRSIHIPHDAETTAGLSMMLAAFTAALTQKFPNHAKELKLLAAQCINDPEWWAKNGKTFENPEVVSVLVHGDMWSPQFLWKGNELLSIVDWQLAHPGSLTEDLLHVLSLCIPVEMRERLTQPLLTHYYQRMTQLMGQKGKKVPFTREYLQKDYRATLPLTATHALFALAWWINSPVLRTGSPLDDSRVAEMEQRVLSIVAHCVKECGWK